MARGAIDTSSVSRLSIVECCKSCTGSDAQDNPSPRGKTFEENPSRCEGLAHKSCCSHFLIRFLIRFVPLAAVKNRLPLVIQPSESEEEGKKEVKDNSTGTL
jgi:hypothetical protein